MGKAKREGEMTHERLCDMLQYIFRFEFNVNLEDFAQMVYGRTESNGPYRRGKIDEIRRRGMAWWWCNLDSANQLTVAKLILKRYPELRELLEKGGGR